MKPVLGTQLNTAHRLNQGLVGCWLFNQRSGSIISDISLNNKNCSLVNGVAWEPSEFGGSISFDGSTNYASMGDNFNMGLSDLTVCVWFRTTDSEYSLIAKSFYGNTPNRWYVGLDQGSGLTSFLRGATTSSVTPGASGYNDGGWHQLIAVYDRDDRLYQYIDGIEINSIDISFLSSDNIQSSYYMFLGAYNDGVSGQSPHTTFGEYNGQIDEVRIYNRALSASEVKELYASKF